MESEPFGEHSVGLGELSWRERLVKLVGELRELGRPESSENVEEERKWVKNRPSFARIQELLDETPREEFLESEEKALIRVVREAKVKSRDLSVRIQENIDCENPKKLRAIWAKVIEQGIDSEEVQNLAQTIIDQEQRLKDRRNAPWSPTPFEMNFEDLKQIYENWDRSQMPKNDYIFGLIEHNKEFFGDFLKEAHKVKKMSANLTEDILLDWLSRLRELKLILDIAAQMEGLIKIRSCLRNIISIVQKNEGGIKNNNLMAKIIEEITSWNRKNLTEEEFKRFKEEVARIKNSESLIDSKDYDWVQFQNKIAGYEWRQEVRLKTGPGQTPSEEDIQSLLKRAPKDLKASKCFEWNSLVEKAKDIEWLDDKQIVERIMVILCEDIGDHNKDQIIRFINNSNISAIGEEALRKIRVLEKIVHAKCSNKIESIQELEDLVKEMLEVKFWNTKTFSYFDDIHRVIQSVHHNASLISNIKQKLSTFNELEPITFELVKKSDKLIVQDMERLLSDFNKLPEKLTNSSISDFEIIDLEMNKFKDFIKEVEIAAKTQAKNIFQVYSSENLQQCKADFESYMKAYYRFALRQESFEETLEILEVLIRACELLEAEDPQAGKEIGVWNTVLNDVKRMWKEEGKQPEIIRQLEGPLVDAKSFLRIVHQIKNGSEKDKKLRTVEEVKTLLREKTDNPGRICMHEQMEYLEKTITRVEEIERLLDQEKVTLQDLKNAYQFMQGIAIQFDGKMETCVDKIQKAEAFKEKLKTMKDDKLEKEFENSTEEYNRLNITIEEIEEIFNGIQECKNLRRDAERLLATEEFTIEEVLEMKSKLIKMKYFRSANIIGRILSKLFYKMREVYESGNEFNTFTIEYCDLCRLIGDAQIVLSKKCKDEVKSDLKEKTGFLNQIFKDVTEHLGKHVYTMSIKQFKENRPDELFRRFVKITGPILDFKKKLEEKEEQLKLASIANEKRRDDYSKPTLKETITQDNRNFYTKLWKDLIAQNKGFNIDPKEVSHTSKILEREIYHKYETEPKEYDKFCEEVTRLFKEIGPYFTLSSQIKAKRFSLKAIKELFDKTSAEIRSLNYTLSRGLLQNGGTTGEKLVQPSNTILGDHGKAMREEKIENNKPKKDSTQDELDREGHLIVTGEYKYYRIYSGDMIIQFNENIKFDKLQMLTCNKASLVSRFSFIPQNLALSTKISRSAFTSYIQKVLSDPQSKYRILPGYLNSFSSQDRLKKLLTEKDLVASKQYTDKCKLFLFPREFLQKEWVEGLEVLTMAREVDLLYFLVYKVGENGKQPGEANIVPEPMMVSSGMKAYRIIYNGGKIKDHNFNIDFLKEQKPTSGLQKAIPEPTIAQIAAQNSRKNVLDLVKSAEEGMNKLLKRYNKTVGNGLNMPQRDLGPSPPTLKTSYRENLAPTGAAKSNGYSRKPTQNRPEWGSKENSQERVERMDTSFENDLIGALQNVKIPNKSFIKQQPKIHAPVIPAFGENSSNLLNQTYSRERERERDSGMSGISKLLGKRPPMTNTSSLLNSSNLMMNQPPTGSIGLENLATPGYERRSFLQTAISSIQVAPAGSLGSMMGSGFDKQAKKSSYPVPRGDTFFKKKLSYGGGLGLGTSTNPLPMEFIKNQFF